MNAFRNQVSPIYTYKSEMPLIRVKCEFGALVLTIRHIFKTYFSGVSLKDIRRGKLLDTSTALIHLCSAVHERY